MGEQRIVRSKRSELLEAAMAGVYGNWIIDALDKTQSFENASLIFPLSVIPLILFFVVSYTQNRKNARLLLFAHLLR